MPIVVSAKAPIAIARPGVVTWRGISGSPRSSGSGSGARASRARASGVPAAPVRAMRVLRAEDRRACVVDPARPEEEALLRPLRVERELVEREVDDPEDVHQLRRQRP